MRKATRRDMHKVVSILSMAFDRNPGVNWMIRNGGDHGKKIRSMMTYAFIKALIRDGVFISSNEKGVALCFKYNFQKFSLSEILYAMKFALTSLNFMHITKILKREAYRERMRPASGEYLYFWFFGVLRDGGCAAFELYHEILNLAESIKMPVYLETALERNHRIYERFGFKTFHYWEVPEEGIQFWFMKWEPQF